jgi:integrase/recombinase XerD
VPTCRTGPTSSSLVAIADGSSDLRPTVELLREVPEEEVWLQGQRSEQTRRAYKADIRHFIETLGIHTREELRQVDRAAVIHWQRIMENQAARPRTIRRRLSALSSLFIHLVSRRLADVNPCREVKRPRVNRVRGETKSFSTKQARALLDAPDPTTLRGLRDRALLSIGLQVGARRSEIARLVVKDFHQNQGYWSLHFVRKGGEDLSVSVNPQTSQRVHEYLAAAGHGDDLEGPLLRPLRTNGRTREVRRHLNPDMVDRVLKKYAKRVGLAHSFSAHSMRATFITTALQNGASLEDVQRDVGHADPTTTKLYDRRGHNPEKSASFFANY